ncbi:hypothetical protein QOZ80_1AG0031490 [Eleusine coracana subsp. coracana]|nr:hypothetical protein QOZ80_1AG0031490 [Eleusine coracana subsp. coracana]
MHAGFINIDCGSSENTSYVESTIKITYVSDFGFTDTGVNRNVSAAYVANKQPYSRHFLTLRSFPDGDRNCYTLRSLTSGYKYLLRAFFMYGDYDGLNKPPIFDVYLGVDLWGKVDLTKDDKIFMLEIIAFSPNDFLQVCLVNKKLGTPIISSLFLRPLMTGLYPGGANASQSLVLLNRDNMGVSGPSPSIVRYPDDPYDRLWFPYESSPEYTQVSTTSPVGHMAGDMFEAPQIVMQTALTPVKNSSSIKYSWQPNPGGINSFFIVFFFSEMKALEANELREFNVFLNDGLLTKNEPYSPTVLMSDALLGTVGGEPEYNITLKATERSTLPPILNAVEVYTIVPVTQALTDNSDVSAITAIKTRYQVKKNWAGDPCVSKAFVWDGLNCSYTAASPSSRVTSLKLSKSDLSGAIVASFADLKALQYLDLSQNNLSGPIPDFLEKLSSLVYL